MPGEVDAVLLREPLHLAEQGDVPRAVPAAAAGRAAGADQTEPVVLPQRLGVHAGQLGGHGDHEDGGVVGDGAAASCGLLTAHLPPARRR